jgi:hypothetical protein
VQVSPELPQIAARYVVEQERNNNFDSAINAATSCKELKEGRLYTWRKGALMHTSKARLRGRFC